MIRLARAGSVTDSTTMRIGTATSASAAVEKVWERSNSKTLPSRMSSTTPGVKKLTWNELRELEQMEGKILEAEETLHKWQKQMEDPKVLADRDKLHADSVVCRVCEC